MIEKKEFSLFDPKPEEEYLKQMAQNGYQLEKVDEQGYHFIESTHCYDNIYVVEFFEDVNDTFDHSEYESQGLKLVSKFITQKGVWCYFCGSNIKEPIKRHLVDRESLLNQSIKRLEMFGLTLSGFLVIFSVFRIIKESSPYFWILLLISLFFFGYILSVYFKLRRLRK